MATADILVNLKPDEYDSGTVPGDRSTHGGSDENGLYAVFDVIKEKRGGQLLNLGQLASGDRLRKGEDSSYFNRFGTVWRH